MKHIAFVLIAAGLSAFTGCIDNHAVTPVGDAPEGLISKPEPFAFQELLFDEVTASPVDDFGPQVRVRGRALAGTQPVRSDEGDFLFVSLDVEAVVLESSPQDAVGEDYLLKIAARSSHLQFRTPKPYASLTVAYPVETRSDGLALAFRFRITRRTISVENVWLTMAENARPEAAL